MSEASDTVNISRESLRVLLELAASAPIQCRASELGQMSGIVTAAITDASEALAAEA